MRFDLVEGASVPTHATSPNRPLLGLGALILALALGLGLGFALDAADSSDSRSGAAARSDGDDADPGGHSEGRLAQGHATSNTTGPRRRLETMATIDE